MDVTLKEGMKEVEKKVEKRKGNEESRRGGGVNGEGRGQVARSGSPASFQTTCCKRNTQRKL